MVVSELIRGDICEQTSENTQKIRFTVKFDFKFLMNDWSNRGIASDCVIGILALCFERFTLSISIIGVEIKIFEFWVGFQFNAIQVLHIEGSVWAINMLEVIYRCPWRLYLIAVPIHHGCWDMVESDNCRGHEKSHFCWFLG